MQEKESERNKDCGVPCLLPLDSFFYLTYFYLNSSPPRNVGCLQETPPSCIPRTVLFLHTQGHRSLYLCSNCLPVGWFVLLLLQGTNSAAHAHYLCKAEALAALCHGGIVYSCRGTNFPWFPQCNGGNLVRRTIFFRGPKLSWQTVGNCPVMLVKQCCSMVCTLGESDLIITWITWYLSGLAVNELNTLSVRYQCWHVPGKETRAQWDHY